MNMIVLYDDPGIGRLLQEVTEWEGHTLVATRDAEEAFRVIERSADPSLLFADNILVSRMAREALPRLGRPQRLLWVPPCVVAVGWFMRHAQFVAGSWRVWHCSSLLLSILAMSLRFNGSPRTAVVRACDDGQTK